MQPEFVDHPVSVFIPFVGFFWTNDQLSVTVRNVSENLFMKYTSVGWAHLSAECELCVCEESTVLSEPVFRTTQR